MSSLREKIEDIFVAHYVESAEGWSKVIDDILALPEITGRSKADELLEAYGYKDIEADGFITVYPKL